MTTTTTDPGLPEPTRPAGTVSGAQRTLLSVTIGAPDTGRHVVYDCDRPDTGELVLAIGSGETRSGATELDAALRNATCPAGRTVLAARPGCGWFLDAEDITVHDSDPSVLADVVEAIRHFYPKVPDNEQRSLWEIHRHLEQRLTRPVGKRRRRWPRRNAHPKTLD